MDARPPQQAAGEHNGRATFTAAAKAFFAASLAAWTAPGANWKELVEQMLNEATSQERVHALQAESWTGYTIKHAMKNRMTAANKAARAAAAAAPDGP